MGEVTKIYNSPVEIAIRVLLILNALSPKKATVEKLMILDHLSLNTFDVGGPVSLHAPVPNRGVQIYSKKAIMDDGVRLLISKNLIELSPSNVGLEYLINDNGQKCLTYFESGYFTQLSQRVTWAVTEFGSMDEIELATYVNQNLENWGQEYMATENSIL